MKPPETQHTYRRLSECLETSQLRHNFDVQELTILRKYGAWENDRPFGGPAISGLCLVANGHLRRKARLSTQLPQDRQREMDLEREGHQRCARINNMVRVCRR